jgi:hypothetical protein
MAKKNTLNDLDSFLKSTSETQEPKSINENFTEKTPHKLVEVEKVSKSRENQEDLQPEDLMAKISELAKREGISEKRFLARLLQQNSNESWLFYFPNLLVQSSFVAYDMAALLKEYYEYLTQTQKQD